MTKTEALQMGVQLTAAVLSNTASASRVLNGPWDTQQLVREYTAMVVQFASEMGIESTEDAPSGN